MVNQKLYIINLSNFYDIISELKEHIGYEILNFDNKEIFDKIYKVNPQKIIINFLNENSLDKETFDERISLLLDPQTCGPLLISCNRKYENTLKDKWYKVGEVVKI